MWVLGNSGRRRSDIDWILLNRVDADTKRIRVIVVVERIVSVRTQSRCDAQSMRAEGSTYEVRMTKSTR